MKKILAMLLAVMMLLSVASVAMAEGDTDTPTTPTYSDHDTVTLTKTYKLNGEGASPAETFTYTIEKVSVTDAASGVTKDNMPVPTFADDNKGEIAFVAGDATTTGNTKSLTINLPAYTSVGVYTYSIKENRPAKSTLGVTYDEAVYELKVTVIHSADGLIREVALRKTGNETKSNEAAFENTYTANQLSVTKKVTGKLGDQSKKFKFKVSFFIQNSNNVEMKSAVTATIAGVGDANFEFGQEYTFELSHDQSAVFANLPAGINYNVWELDEDDKVISDTEKQKNGNYTVSYDSNDDLTDGTAKQTTITNNYDGNIDMGVMLDSMPYVLVLAVVGAAVIALIAKKRRAED